MTGSVAHSCFQMINMATKLQFPVHIQEACHAFIARS